MYYQPLFIALFAVRVKYFVYKFIHKIKDCFFKALKLVCGEVATNDID